MMGRPVDHQRTIAGRQRALMRWYRRHGRHDLPWRKTRDPYAILVSEVMLQQTQVDRVIPYWNAWMRRWPTVQSLARAKRSDTIRMWAGLGYNRRAVYLHRAAQEIHHDSALRQTFSHSQECENVLWEHWSGFAGRLRELPGVGPYTMNALLAFAWNRSAPCVDTNVRRVLAHAVYRRPAIMRLPLREVMRLASRVIPLRQGRDWNYALMDYGALVLTASRCPKLDFGHVRLRQKIERFEGSSRFWRGRIVAVLREAPQTLVELQRALHAYGVPPRTIAPFLAALTRDGVIAHRQRRYQLA